MSCNKIINKKTFHVTHNLNHNPAELTWQTDFNDGLTFEPNAVIVRNVVDNTNIVADPNVPLKFDPATASPSITLSNNDYTLTKTSDNQLAGAFGDIVFNNTAHIDLEFVLDSRTGDKRSQFGVVSTDIVDPGVSALDGVNYFLLRVDDKVKSSEGDQNAVLKWDVGVRQRMVILDGELSFFYWDGMNWVLNMASSIVLPEGDYNLISQDDNNNTGGYVITMTGLIASYVNSINSMVYVTTDVTPVNNNYFTPINTTNIGSVIASYKYDDGVHYYITNAEYELINDFQTTKIMNFKLFHMKPEDDDTLFFEDLNDGSITLELEFIQYANII